MLSSHALEIQDKDHEIPADMCHALRPQTDGEPSWKEKSLTGSESRAG